MEEKKLTEQESLDLITQMINKAKDVCHDTGIAAIMWGTIIAVCSLIRLSEIHFEYRLPFDIYLLTFIAVVPQIYFSIKEKKARKVKTYGEAFTDYLWIAFGICIFLLVYITGNMNNEWSLIAKEYKQLAGHTASFSLYEFSAPLFLLLYGLPTFVTGTCMKFKPMLFGGLFCWICCLITVHTTIKIDLILMALSAVFAWLIPGIIMEKEYRKAKRDLAAANV